MEKENSRYVDVPISYAYRLRGRSKIQLRDGLKCFLKLLELRTNLDAKPTDKARQIINTGGDSDDQQTTKANQSGSLSPLDVLIK